jgi:hypothetical protein
VVDDWQRTLRLVVILLAGGASLAGILFVLQLNPNRWVSAVAVGASVVAGVFGLGRREGRQ